MSSGRPCTVWPPQRHRQQPLNQAHAPADRVDTCRGRGWQGWGAEGQQSLFVRRKKYCSTRLNNAALGAYLAQQQEGRRLISSCLLVSLCLSVSLSLSPSLCHVFTSWLKSSLSVPSRFRAHGHRAAQSAHGSAVEHGPKKKQTQAQDVKWAVCAVH